MVHIESLDARRLMAAAGLDASFGKEGVAGLPGLFLPGTGGSGVALEAGRAVIAGDNGDYFIGGYGPGAGMSRASSN